ncbi:hypothetical protein GCM10010924_52590 [Rhizobium wenxiniae]|nr:hypothetical protein GCM10010924_52590 [Rhizobium wenxiniae]
MNTMAAEVMCSKTPTSIAATSPPTCMEKNVTEFDVLGARCFPTIGIIACDVVNAMRSQQENSTADQQINHAELVKAIIAAARHRTQSATMNTRRRSKRSDIQPAPGLTNNSVRLTVAKNAATVALPSPEATSIQAQAMA